MPRYRVRCGVEVAAIGDVWAAFSPASGETQLLNDEAAAILEVLDESPRTPQEVAEAMAKDRRAADFHRRSALEGFDLPARRSGSDRGVPTRPYGQRDSCVYA